MLQCVRLVSVSFLARICSDMFRRSSVDLMFALGAFWAKKHKNHYSLIVFWKKMAQSPRNLAFSVCRTTFPRFSDSSTLTLDPSAARILDPLRRSRPHTKPPCSAYALRMRGLFLHVHVQRYPSKRKLCWKMLCSSCSSVFQHILENLVRYYPILWSIWRWNK